ncbi:MAG: HWE histidine kinase domain-containing protein, partial [Hyphomicrobiaceae bacterium]
WRLACLSGVIGGALAGGALIHGNIGAGAIFALCNGLECLLFQYILEAVDPEPPRLERLGSVIAFLSVAVIASSAAALPAAFMLRLMEFSQTPFFDLWNAWMRADATGIVAIAPVIITGWRVMKFPPTMAVAVEGVAASLAVGIVALGTFGTMPFVVAWTSITPAVALFPLLLWVAGRMPPFFSALSVLIVSFVVVIAAQQGAGHFNLQMLTLGERIQSAQISVFAAALCALALAAMFARHRNIADALRTSDRRLQLALNASGIFTFDYDMADGTVHRYGALAQKLGLGREGTTDEFTARLHKGSQGGVRELMGYVSAENPTHLSEMKVRAADGSILTLQQRAEGIFDASNRLVRIIGSCIDITQSRQIEEALGESEERLRIVLKTARIYTFDCDFRTGYATRSENAVEILGLPPSSSNFTLQMFRRQMHPDDLAELKRVISGFSSSKDAGATVVRFTRPIDGKVIWLENILGASYDETGRKVRLSGITRDVTHRKMWEVKQDALIDELNHRVKNSLARMAVVIQRSRQSHDTLDDYMAALSGRIESMARTHQRLATSQWTGVSLSTLVEDELTPYRTPNNIVLAGPEVIMPPGISQAVSTTLHELATNAAKYGGLAHPNGRVKVTWTVDHDETTGGRVLKLDWQERAGSFVPQPDFEGFGTSTIRNLLRYEYQATVELTFDPGGAKCRIVLPLTRSNESRGADNRLPSKSVL